MKKLLKDNKHLIFIFLFTFLIYEIFAFYLVYGDANSNYSFSYAVAKGQIPYKEFNIISTPLYAFIMAIGLKISNSYLMFIIEQSILVTTQFYFLSKIYGKKSYLIYLSMVFLVFLALTPTYNYMCFFCMIVLLYLEKKHKDKDYLIGLFIGLSILSKHTVGVFFILPTIIFYYKDIKKILKRALGALIPGVMFVIYLLLTNSFNSFIDLCVLGLFDFSSSNRIFTLWFFVSVIILIIEIILIKKAKKSIINYYLLCSISFVIPLFDLYHFSLVFTTFIMMILPYINIRKENINKFIIPIIIILAVDFFTMFVILENKPIRLITNLSHYNYTFRYKDEFNFFKGFNKLVDKDYKKYNNVIVHGGYYKTTMDIVNDRKINYFDILLYGNYGLDGSNSMIRKLDKMSNSIFIYKIDEYSARDSQYDKKIIDYVRKNWKRISRKKSHYYKYGFELYYKE